MTLNFYKVHQFTAVGNSNFVVTSAPSGAEVEYVIVGGGGGGCLGGGGAGGYRSSVTGERSGANSAPENKVVVSNQSYPVVVGAGGIGRINSSGNQGADGGASSIFGISAAGGGGGGGGATTGAHNAGRAGGSGGGAHNFASPGTGQAGQGRNGGSTSNAGNATGGGGAFSLGGNAVASIGGASGLGIFSAITGISVSRSGGGAGYSAISGAARGGGGGNFSAGLPNTGGGGFGSLNRAYSGGSGIVIVRYPTATFVEPNNVIQATGGTIEYILDGTSIYKTHRFTTSGTFTFAVTDVGRFNQKLKFVTSSNSTFNSVSSFSGVLTPATQSYTVVVGTGGFVDVSYPLSSLQNDISHIKINRFAINARGGEESTTTVNGKLYKVHRFKNVGTSKFQVFDVGQLNDVEYLIVGGGGSGGGRHGGGGGGGGYISGTRGLERKTYNVVVGAGGRRVEGNGVLGASGNPSSFAEEVANGGGGGGVYGDSGASTQTALAGGSGGGSGYFGALASSNQPAVPNGTAFGNSGGGNSGNVVGGGGGGAGGAGGAGTSVQGGDGGPGRQWLDGLYYAAGGGGSNWNGTGRAGNGGIGGGGGGNRGDGGGAQTAGTGGGSAQNSGGNGGFVTNSNVRVFAGDGGANTGSGGGGAEQSGYLNYRGVSGAGGSGIVIIRYPLEPIN